MNVQQSNILRDGISQNSVRISVDLIRSSYRSESFPSDWDEEKRRHAYSRYLKWLELKIAHPNVRLAPTRDIDMFWHLHMLSPVAYQKDCNSLFGRILDHDGGFGATPEELPELIQVFTETAKLWERRYSEPYGEDGLWASEFGQTACWHDCQDRCWHACSDN